MTGCRRSRRPSWNDKAVHGIPWLQCAPRNDSVEDSSSRRRDRERPHGWNHIAWGQNAGFVHEQSVWRADTALPAD